MMNSKKIVAAFDYGERRIGAALMDTTMQLPYELHTFATEDGFEPLKRYIVENNVDQLVVGNPRNQSGEETEQTKQACAFADQLAQQVGLPLAMQDESLTSVLAEERLKQRGVPYKKEDIDAQAAAIIVGDYIRDHEKFTYKG